MNFFLLPRIIKIVKVQNNLVYVIDVLFVRIKYQNIGTFIIMNVPVQMKYNMYGESDVF